MTPQGGYRIGAGRKPASETGRANGRRVNVYLNPANLATWDSLPARMRSRFVNDAMAAVRLQRVKLVVLQHLTEIVYDCDDITEAAQVAMGGMDTGECSPHYIEVGGVKVWENTDPLTAYGELERLTIQLAAKGG